MLQKIRKNVFETNSSSSHSLTMAQGDVIPMPLSKNELRDGKVIVRLDDYGWEWHRYYTPINKIAYLLTQALLGTGEYGDARVPAGDDEAVTRALCEENDLVARMCEVVKAHTGCELLLASGSRGSIDHDSVGNGRELFSSAAELTQFIFSAESYIETGNDNSGPNKLIDTDRGREHYYQAHYREPEADWVSLKLRCEGLWQPDFTLESGAVLREAGNEALLEALVAQATVVAVHWATVGPWAHFDYGTPVGRTMEELSEVGFKFSEQITADEDFTKTEFRSDTPRKKVLTLTLRVPAALAEELAQLPVPKAKKPRKKAVSKKEA